MISLHALREELGEGQSRDRVILESVEHFDNIFFQIQYNARQCENRNLKVNSDRWKTFIWVSFNSNNFTKVQKTSTLLKPGIPELQSQQQWIYYNFKR